MRARWSPAWLWLLVALQVAIPSSYYLVREDSDDERFAWRMFSAVRQTRCDVEAFESRGDGVPRSIDLPHSLHASWIRSLERGRAKVIERFLAGRCRAEIAKSSLDRSCRNAAGRALPRLQYRYDCAARRLEAAP